MCDAGTEPVWVVHWHGAGLTFNHIISQQLTNLSAMASTTVEVAKQQKNAGPGGRRGRGNRGRGGRNNKPNDNDNAPIGITKTDHPGIGHNLTKSPTALDTEENADTTKAPTESELDSNDVCWICAETIKFYAISECNHRMCHICALRLRALYKKQECAFCKVWNA